MEVKNTWSKFHLCKKQAGKDKICHKNISRYKMRKFPFYILCSFPLKLYSQCFFLLTTYLDAFRDETIVDKLLSRSWNDSCNQVNYFKFVLIVYNDSEWRAEKCYQSWKWTELMSDSRGMIRVVETFISDNHFQFVRVNM